MEPSKGGQNNLSWMYGQNHKSKKDELNSVDKRIDRQQSIVKRYVSAQNYLVYFKVQSLVTMKCHSTRLQVEVNHELYKMYQSIPSIIILPRTLLAELSIHTCPPSFPLFSCRSFHVRPEKLESLSSDNHIRFLILVASNQIYVFTISTKERFILHSRRQIFFGGAKTQLGFRDAVNLSRTKVAS